MTVVELGDYEPWPSPFPGRRAADLTRAEAKQAFAHVVDGIPERLRQLADLCERNGLDNDPDGWTTLLDMIERDPDDPSTWAPVWSTIGYDIALAFAERVIERSEGSVHWKMDTAKTSLTYQQPQLAGFTNVPNKHYAFNPYVSVTSFMRRRLGGETDDGLGPFLEYIASKE